MTLANSADLTNVFHRDGLSAAGIIGNREHDERDAFAADPSDEGFERGDIHVAFEGMRRCGMFPFLDHKVDGLGSDEFNVGARGIEVRVVGNDIPFLAGHSE